MIQHSFSTDDQINFAKLSGDYNPVHLDPIKARRTRFGQPVLHGLHALFWALENFIAPKPDTLLLVSLKAYFNQPIILGEKIQFILKSEDEACAEIQLLSKNKQAVRIMVSYSFSDNKGFLNYPDLNPDSRKCLDKKPEQLAHTSGSLDLCLNQSETSHRFPNLMRVFPSNQLAELMALTRLVGMECPGLHSIFSDLNIKFSSPSDEAPRLNYKVLSYDPRIRLLTQNVQAPGMTGTLRAFVPPPPQNQESYLELSKQVEKDEFANQTALILGGSRGLGEVTAKLLAAGGARVTISYHLGDEDANNTIKQIMQGGGVAKCLAFNVLSQNSFPKDDLTGDWNPTHLYYFATPQISPGQRDSFSVSLFQRFCDYYVSGFFNTFQTIQKLGKGLQGIFYPSTVFIDDLPVDMAEYTAAKSAGETLCALLRKKYLNLNIYSPKLPKTATDQTNALLSPDKKDPGPLMLENLRHFRDKGDT